MKNIAIIPARGGSKRIPRKNIKLFMGKPIIAYSIEAALQSGLFEEVMVSTDDEEIAEIARQYGAKVPFMRSKENSNDYAGLSDVIDEVLNNYSSTGVSYDNWCCLLSTAPFVTSSLLNDSYHSFIIGSFDTLRPIIRFSYPIQRAFRMDDDGAVSFINPEYISTRTQDLEPTFHDAGLFYWGTVNKGFGGNKWGGIEIDENYCQDIDTESDWELAELKFRMLHEVTK